MQQNVPSAIAPRAFKNASGYHCAVACGCDLLAQVADIINIPTPDNALVARVLKRQAVADENTFLEEVRNVICPKMDGFNPYTKAFGGWCLSDIWDNILALVPDDDRFKSEFVIDCACEQDCSWHETTTDGDTCFLEEIALLMLDDCAIDDLFYEGLNLI